MRPFCTLKRFYFVCALLACRTMHRVHARPTDPLGLEFRTFVSQYIGAGDLNLGFSGRVARALNSELSLQRPGPKY